MPAAVFPYISIEEYDIETLWTAAPEEFYLSKIFFRGPLLKYDCTIIIDDDLTITDFTKTLDGDRYILVDFGDLLKVAEFYSEDVTVIFEGLSIKFIFPFIPTPLDSTKFSYIYFEPDSGITSSGSSGYKIGVSDRTEALGVTEVPWILRIPNGPQLKPFEPIGGEKILIGPNIFSILTDQTIPEDTTITILSDLSKIRLE